MNNTFTLALISSTASALNISTLITTAAGDAFETNAQQYIDSKLCAYRYALNDDVSLFDAL